MALRAKCQQCVIRLETICGEVSQNAASELGRIGLRRRIPAGQVIQSEHQNAKSFGVILSGVVKLVKAKPDGRQQIVGLQFPADFVGHIYRPGAGLFAEAATDIELCCFAGASFEALLQEHPDIERALLKRTIEDLDAAREWMFVLGRKTAQERVASLLLMIADRMSGVGKPAGLSEFMLPLSRTEMAEFLCLRLETVSRQIATLKGRGVIKTSRRRSFSVSDISTLTECAENAPD